jgi:hypothetical protein
MKNTKKARQIISVDRARGYRPGPCQLISNVALLLSFVKSLVICLHWQWRLAACPRNSNLLPTAGRDIVIRRVKTTMRLVSKRVDSASASESRREAGSMPWPLWLGTRFRANQGAPLRASGVDRSARPSEGSYHAKNAKKRLFGLRELFGAAECFARPSKFAPWGRVQKTLGSVGTHISIFWH